MLSVGVQVREWLVIVARGALGRARRGESLSRVTK